MKKQFWTLLLCASLFVPAQEASALVRFGVRAGTYLTGGLPLNEQGAPKFNEVDFKNLRFGGFTLGPVVEVGSQFICLETGLMYANQTFAFTKTGIDQTLTANVHNFEIPVNLKLRIGIPKLVSVHAFVGPLLEYQFATNATDQLLDNLQNKMRFGGNLGAGVTLFDHFEAAFSYQLMINSHANFWKLTGDDFQNKAYRISLTYFF